MSRAPDHSLIARWPFTAGSHEPVGSPLSVRNHGVRVGEPGPRPGTGAARFDGRDAFLEVADHPALRWGTRGFTIAGWVHTDAEDGDVVGDLIGKFDPEIPDRTSSGHPDQHRHDQHGPAELPQPPVRHRQRPIRPPLGRLRSAGRAPC